MSDSERIVAFRSAVPFPSPARLAAGRERLLTAATTAGSGAEGARHSPRRGAFLRWRPMIALSAAVAVAAGTGYALTAHGGRAVPSARSATPSASSATATQTVFAAKVLSDAAKVARRSTVTEPSPGQWIFYENTTVTYRNPAPRTSDPEWITFDGGQTAYHDGPNGTGPLVVHTKRTKFPPPGMNPWTALDTYRISPKIAWDVLDSLPASPRAVLAVVAEHTAAPGEASKQQVAGPGSACSGPFADGQGATSAEREFDCLSALMWNAQVGFGGPPAGDAAAFRAMAALPGISVQEGTTDARGAPAIGVSADGGRQQLLLNPATYQVIGLRWFSRGIAPGARKSRKPALGRPGNSVSYPPKGALVFSTASTYDKLVAAPGDR